VSGTEVLRELHGDPPPLVGRKDFLETLTYDPVQARTARGTLASVEHLPIHLVVEAVKLHGHVIRQQLHLGPMNERATS
jgi:hypothetical protein